MPAPRLPLPAAYVDVAFHRCCIESLETAELVQNFERLYEVNLHRDGEKGLRAFAEFVHDGIYMRLPDEAIEALRV